MKNNPTAQGQPVDPTMKTDDEIIIMSVPIYDALVQTVKTLSGNLQELQNTFTSEQNEMFAESQALMDAFHRYADQTHYARKAS